MATTCLNWSDPNSPHRNRNLTHMTFDIPPPETNIAPEHWLLEDEFFFWGGPGLCTGVNSLLVSGRAIHGLTLLKRCFRTLENGVACLEYLHLNSGLNEKGAR